VGVDDNVNASDMIPMSDELAEELEALEAIFAEEMSVERGGATPRLTFALGGDVLPGASLTLVLPPGYPAGAYTRPRFSST
jgi:hypothetical protein